MKEKKRLRKKVRKLEAEVKRLSSAIKPLPAPENITCREWCFVPPRLSFSELHVFGNERRVQ